MSESELPEGEMTEAEMKNELDLLKEINDLKPPKLKTLISKLKYMGNQYSAGQVARGGSAQEHYLTEASEELDTYYMKWIKANLEVGDLRNVIQSALISGVPGMVKTWNKYFPNHPIEPRPLRLLTAQEMGDVVELVLTKGPFPPEDLLDILNAIQLKLLEVNKLPIPGQTGD